MPSLSSYLYLLHCLKYCTFNVIYYLIRSDPSRIVEEVNFRQFIRTLALFHKRGHIDSASCNEKRIECE